MDFVDFNILVQPTGMYWSIASTDSDAGVVMEQTEPPFSFDVLDNIRLQIENAAVNGAMRRIRPRSEKIMQDRGLELFERLVPGRIRNALRRAYREHNRLRIRIQTDAALAAYPFELAFSEDQDLHGHLALRSNITLVRSTRNVGTTQSLEPIQRPIRLLVVIASPTARDLDKIDANKEVTRIKQALNYSFVEIDFIRGKGTYRQLQARLGRGIGYHILHFVGHGGYDEETKEGLLFFEGDDGTPHEVSAEAFNSLVGSPGTIRLVTLNCCHGGRVGPKLLSGVAMSVFALGIPAVVAMQYAITDSAAIEFASSFYSYIAMGFAVDHAMTLTRGLLHQAGGCIHSSEWATPVLYLGSNSGDVFGLSFDPAELTALSVDALHAGHWDKAAATAAFVIEQAFDDQPTVEKGSEIKAVGEEAACLFAGWEHYRTEMELLEFGVAARTFQELVDHATAMDIAQMEKVLGPELGMGEVLLAVVRTLRSLGEGEYEEARGECDRYAHRTDIDFLFSYLKDRISAEEKVASHMGRFQDLISTGEWFSVHTSLVSDLNDTEIKGAISYSALGGKLGLARTLQKVANAMEMKAYTEARLALEKVEPGEGDPAVSLVKQLAGIGETALEVIESSDVDGLQAQNKLLDDLSGTLSDQAGVVLSAHKRLQILLEKGIRDTTCEVGMTLYESGQFEHAMRHFEKMESLFRDSEEFLAYRGMANQLHHCKTWIGFHRDLQDRKWAEAKTRLKEIPRGEARADRWRRWCNEALRFVPVLEKMAGRQAIRDPRVPWEGGVCPYAVLDVSPSIGMEEIKDVAFVLQGNSGGMSEFQRRAWDTLRVVDKRLLVDSSLYVIGNPRRAEEILGRIVHIKEGTDPDKLVQGLAELGKNKAEKATKRQSMRKAITQFLEEDKGVFNALLGDYDAAIGFFETRAKARPEDPETLHGLALASAGKLHVQGADDPDLARVWDLLILSWGAVFADDRFWHRLWASRRKIYQVTNDQIQDARSRLQRFWMDEVKSIADEYPGLDIRFQAEINGARAVNAGGGIPLQDSPDKRVVVGPMGARALDLTEVVSLWLGSFGSKVLQEDGWQRRACRYFSDLSGAMTLFEAGRYEDALDHLDSASQEPVDDSPAANPGFAGFDRGAELLRENRFELLAQTHTKLALAAVSEFPPRTEEVMGHWRGAVEAAERAGTLARTLAEIRDIAIGRAASLQNKQRSNQLDALNDAVKILDYVTGQGWDNQEQVVQDALVDTLQNRAVHLSNEYDAEREAREDAQRAWAMRPNSPRSIQVLCMASFHHANDLLSENKRDLAEELLKEIEERLEEGERQFPGNADLAGAREHAIELQKRLTGGGIFGLANLLKGIGANPKALESPKAAGAGRLQEAMVKEAQQQYADAVSIYWALVQADPSDPGPRNRMAWCYRAWIVHLQSTGTEPPEIRRITQEALERCPDSQALSDLAGKLTVERED